MDGLFGGSRLRGHSAVGAIAVEKAHHRRGEGGKRAAHAAEHEDRRVANDYDREVQRTSATNGGSDKSHSPCVQELRQAGAVVQRSVGQRVGWIQVFLHDCAEIHRHRGGSASHRVRREQWHDGRGRRPFPSFGLRTPHRMDGCDVQWQHSFWQQRISAHACGLHQQLDWRELPRQHGLRAQRRRRLGRLPALAGPSCPSLAGVGRTPMNGTFWLPRPLAWGAAGLVLGALFGCSSGFSGANPKRLANASAPLAAAPARSLGSDNPGINLQCDADRFRKAPAPFHWSYDKIVPRLTNADWEADVTPDSITGTFIDSSGKRAIHGLRSDGTSWNTAVSLLTAPLPASTFA